MTTKLPVGKLSNDLLKRLLSRLPVVDSGVLISPGIGCDAAGLSLNSQFWAVTTDPITLTGADIMMLALAVNINDVVCLGCEPRYFLSNILLPVGTTELEILDLWEDLVRGLHRYRVQAIGGHTEITTAVNRPIVIGQMIGELAAPRFFNIHDARPGHKILLWRPPAIEGTALLASECYAQLSKKILPAQLDTMRQLPDDMGLCILEAGKKLFQTPGVVCLHDPTEGGLATALHELADACGYGLDVFAGQIPILSETRQLAAALDFDPLGLIASGCLLIVCEAGAVSAINALFAQDIIAEIGEITETPERYLIVAGARKILPRFDQDEAARVLEKYKS